MSDTATLTYDGQTYEFPVVTGSENEKGLDVAKLRAQSGLITLDPGYGNTGSCESAITYIDGDQGILRYRGIPIEQFAKTPNFGEVAWLLIFGHLPTQAEYDAFSQSLTEHAFLDESMKHHFEGFPRSAAPMAMMSAMINALSCFHPEFVMDTLLPNQGKWSCRWFLLKIKLHGINPKSIITDGLVGYIGAIHQVFPAAKHLLCIFHHQQSVSRWVKKYLGDLSTDKQQLIKGKMKRVVQTEDSRTVFRRLESLEKKNDKEKWGIEPWLKAMHEKLPRLLPAIRKNQHPRTTNAIERFFRQFQRFYKTRNGFHSVKSAVDQLAVFSVTYLFTCQAKSGKAPIEIIMPEATRMPLYQILNDPISWLPSVTQAVDLSRCAVDGDENGEMADIQYKLTG